MRINMSRFARASVATLATVTLATGAIPAVAFADTDEVEKTQVVYVKADATGAEEGVYVVNQFENTSGSDAVEVTDAGNYTSVKNLTDTQELNAIDGSTFEVSDAKPFLYQGDLSAETELPWSVSVSYKLDGTAAEAAELAGKSGVLEMTISITPNDACPGDYADNYLLQVSASLDNDLASNIAADDATIAQDSGNTKLSYMLFPGKSANYTVTADVKDFEFDGWQLVGVPLSIALDIDDSEFSDATESLDDLEQAIKDINDGASSINDAMSELLDGSNQLKDGSSDVSDGASSLSSAIGSLFFGASSLSSATSTLSDGAKSLSSATDTLATGTAQLSSLLQQFADAGEQLIAGSASYKSGLNTQANGLASQAASIDVSTPTAQYQTAMQTYVATFAAVFAQAYSQAVAAGQSPEQAQATASAAAQAGSATQQAAVQSALQALVTAQATKTGYQSASDALTQAVSSYEQVDSGIQTYVANADQLASAAASLDSGADQINGAAAQLANGASSVNEGADQLASGTSSVNSGVNSLSSGASSLMDGASSLASGATNLKDGTGELASGTQEAVNETNDMSQEMIDQIRDKLTEYLNPTFELTDFVNGSTEDIDNVQFVFKTDAIEIPDDNTDDEEVQEEKSFFEKFAALFMGEQ